MSFGFEAINNGNSVLISDFQNHLHFSERGVMTVTASRVDVAATGVVTFATNVLTQAPPKIFVRLISSAHSSMNLYTVMIGAPGNWTGFRIYAGAQGGGTLPNYQIDWVCCKNFDRDTTQTYGMTIYDANGNTIFTSDKKLVKYSKFTKDWTVQRTFANARYFFTYFPTNITIDNDDYIDISSINRGRVNQLVDGLEFTSMVIYSASTRVLRLQTQSVYDQSSPQQMSTRKFCIPICKFPSSVFYN